MVMIQQILDEECMIEAIEFGCSDDFIMVFRRVGQRREQHTRLTLGQLRLLIAALGEQGRTLQDAIDDLYEEKGNEYNVLFRGKRLRVSLTRLLGHPCSLVWFPGLPGAAA